MTASSDGIIRRHHQTASSDASAGAASQAARGQIRATGAPPGSVTHAREKSLRGGKQTAANKVERGGAKEASHMLLYLNEDTFVGAEGEAFADEVRCTLTRTLTLHPHRSPPTRTRTRTRTLTRCAARSPTASRW